MQIKIYQDKKTKEVFVYKGDFALEDKYPRLILISTVIGFNLLAVEHNKIGDVIRTVTWRDWKTHNMPSKKQLEERRKKQI